MLILNIFNPVVITEASHPPSQTLPTAPLTPPLTSPTFYLLYVFFDLLEFLLRNGTF